MIFIRNFKGGTANNVPSSNLVKNYVTVDYGKSNLALNISAPFCF